MKEINITEAEWPIMETLWGSPTATAAEIVARVGAGRPSSARTIKTLLRRLVAKGAAGFEVDPNDARLYHYRALIVREEALAKKNKSFLRLYGSSLSEMFSHFIRNSDMSREEIAELKAVLAGKEKENV